VPAKRSGGAGIREAHRELTRKRIIDAAFEQFDAHGFAKPSLDSIAEAAEVNRGTIYLHFKNKAEILGALAANLEAEVTPRTESLREARSRGEVAQVCLENMEGWDGAPGKILTWMQDGAVSDHDLLRLFDDFRMRSIARLRAVLSSNGVSATEAEARATLLWSAAHSACTAGVKGLISVSARRAIAEAYADMFLALCKPSKTQRVVPLAARRRGQAEA
jgi:AcrR family transcriptional regulator